MNAGLITDLQFVTGAGGRHVAVVIDGNPCGYMSKRETCVELYWGRSAPAYLRDAFRAQRAFASLDEGRASITRIVSAQPGKMVIAL